MNRPNIDGKGQALHGDRTTTGALLISYISNFATCNGRGFILRGDKTGICPKCGKEGTVTEGAHNRRWHGTPIALDMNIVSCGCPDGTNRIIAPLGPIPGTETNNSIAPENLQIHSSQSIEKTISPTRFDLQFLLIEQNNNKPKPNTPYRITLETGEVHLGVSDKNGLTKAVFANSPLKVTIEAPHYESAEPAELCTDICQC